MDTVQIPRALFEAAARYLLVRAAHDDQAQGLYNGLVVALATQPKPEGDALDTAGIPAVE